MDSVPNVTSSEKQFIEYLIGYIVDTNPGDLIANLKDITTHIQDTYPPKHELNKFRKSYGNFKDCIKAPGISAVFRLDGTAFKFQHPSKI